MLILNLKCLNNLTISNSATKVEVVISLTLVIDFPQVCEKEGIFPLSPGANPIALIPGLCIPHASLGEIR